MQDGPSYIEFKNRQQLQWLNNTFGQLNWNTDKLKYPDYVATAPIYDKKISEIIAIFFNQVGFRNAQSLQSQSGDYHRVFLPLKELEHFIMADQFRDGRLLGWGFMLQQVLEDHQASMDTLTSNMTKLRT